MLSVVKRIFFILFFILLWVGIDHLTNRVSISGFATPWYPQIAMSLVLLLALGLHWGWLIFVAKFTSSIVVWPTDFITERILPNLIFTIGIIAICYWMKKLRKNPAIVQIVIPIIAMQALVLLAVAIFRTVYYADKISEYISITNGIFFNWLSDFTSLICLTPGLIIIFDPARREHRSIGFQYLKKYWYLPAMIVLIEALVLLLPSDLPERLWYIIFLPCIAFAVLSGLEGTLLLLFFTNLFLGGVAIASFSREATTAMQVFFMSMNLLIIFLGFVTNDRRLRIVKILSSNREYIHSQFNKVNALILMQSEISINLKEILKELEAHASTQTVATAAKEFLQKLDVFFAKLELKKSLATDLKYVQSIYLKQRIREELVAALPGHFPVPSIEVSKKIPVQIELDLDFFDVVIKQIANLIYQINPHSKTQSQFLIDWKENELHIQVKILGSMKSVQAQQISFMSAYWTFQQSLPSGGFALTSYILHALAARVGGEFWLQPLWFSHEDVLVVEFIIPIGLKKNVGREPRL